MARRLQLGSPTGVDEESRWKWIEESLRQIERASHEDNLGGVDEAFDNIKVAATSTYAGVVELATVTEVLTGTDAERAVTPDAMAGLWEEGPDIAWASTISVGEGGYFHVIASSTTGSIDAIDFGTQKDGRAAILKFDSPGTLVYSSGLVLPTTGVNITVSSGDCAHVVQDSSVVSRVVFYQKADGTAVVVVSTAPSFPLSVANGGTGQTTASEAVGELIQALSTMSTIDRVADLVAAYDASTDSGAAMQAWQVAGMAVLAKGTVAAGTTALELPLDNTGYSNFRNFKLYVRAIPAGTSNIEPWLRMSDDGGATFEADASDYTYSAAQAESTGVVTPLVAADDSKIVLGQVVLTGEPAHFDITIYSPASTAPCAINWHASFIPEAAAFYSVHGGGMMVSSVDVTDIQFRFSTGTWSGSYTLIGME